MENKIRRVSHPWLRGLTGSNIVSKKKVIKTLLSAGFLLTRGSSLIKIALFLPWFGEIGRLNIFIEIARYILKLPGFARDFIIFSLDGPDLLGLADLRNWNCMFEVWLKKFHYRTFAKIQTNWKNEIKIASFVENF